MWRKALLAVVATIGTIALPLLALPTRPQTGQRFPSSGRGSISLVAIMPETASLAWSMRALPPDPSEPDLHAEVFVLQDQSVLARGRSSEVRCEWDGTVGDSSGLLPLAGFPEAIPFQFSFLPRMPLKKLILPSASSGFSREAKRMATFLAVHPSNREDTPAILRITLEAF